MADACPRRDPANRGQRSGLDPLPSLPASGGFGILLGERRASRAPPEVARRFEVGERVPHFFYWSRRRGGTVSDRDLSNEIEAGLAELGFELVELERAGTPKRPVLRLRIDRRPAVQGESGVSVDDCARASRVLERRLEADERFPATYVLEVSSPGVERPLIRRRDFERFVGSEVALQGKQPLAGRARKLTGELVGIRGAGEEETVTLRLPTGEELDIPRAEVTRANLVFRWGSEGRRT